MVETKLILLRSKVLLSEQEVARSWSKLFKRGDFSPESFTRAEELIEELRPESPLRHRLARELEELRAISAKRSGVAVS